jgi:amino acid adenylation domain-containing protein/non-ribosomal peptide synthase protein (TIGR01720 family)
MKAGGAYVPLDPDYPDDRISFMLEDTFASLVVVTSSTERKISHSGVPFFVSLDGDAEGISMEQTGDVRRTLTVDHLAYVIYTSGSTGKPKGVMVEHKGVVNMIYNHIEVLALKPGLKVLQFASVSFDGSCQEIFNTLASGGTVVMIAKDQILSPDGIGDVLKAHSIDIATIPPSYQHVILESMDGLQILYSAGEPLNVEIGRSILEKGPRLINGYGPTENSVTVTLTDHPIRNGKVTIGRPINNVQVYILDEFKKPVPIGVAGELFVAGLQLARGYLNREDLTREKFICNPFGKSANSRMYQTGDLGRWLPDGNIEYLGRIDEQVKIRGYRIELGEIENILAGHSSVKATVVSVSGADSDKELVAYIVSQEAFNPAVLMAYLSSRLPGYMVPRIYIPLDGLPVSPNGKVDRKKLPPPALTSHLTDNFVPPINEKQKRLVLVWCEVLRLNQVGIRDNFFTMGGNSISAIEVVSKARKEGIELSIGQIFEYPTIESISQVVDWATRSYSEEEVVTGRMELLPIQHWYLDNHQQDMHYYCYTSVLETPKNLTAKICSDIVLTLLRQHDALRLHISHENQREGAFDPLTEEMIASVLQIIQCAEVNEEEWAQLIGVQVEIICRTISVFTGPLIKVVWFDPGNGLNGRLLLVVHHLVVDGISWRVLLDNIHTLFSQVRAQQVLQLGRKTSSYKRWSAEILKYANSEKLLAERDFWCSVLKEGGTFFPADTEKRTGLVKNQRQVVIELNGATTRQLAQDANRAYKTQIKDLLLTGLSIAIFRWSEIQNFLVSLEGHGREGVLGLDVSETVGWFTSSFPVLFRRTQDPGIKDELGSVIKDVKENLRNTPEHGIGYGILRYITQDIAVIHYESKSVIPVLFNYLGDFQSNDYDFASGTGISGFSASPNHTVLHSLEFNGAIVNGLLKFSISYDKDEYHDVTVMKLAEYFKCALEEIIHHCVVTTTINHTPSDFPLAKLKQDKINELESTFRDIADVYPATAMQKSMYFYSAVADEPGFFIGQHHGEMTGVDPELFKVSWERLIDRHSILRTSFVICEVNGLLQVVASKALLPYRYLDVRYSTPETVKDQITAAIKEDQHKGFDFENAPLLRLTLIHSKENALYLILSFHHIIQDGWSMPILFSELNTIYSGLVTNSEVSLLPVPNYAQYLKWLFTQNTEKSRQFWKEELGHVDHITKLSTSSPDLWSAKTYAELEVALSPTHSDLLKRQAARFGVTLNTLLVGAWGILLSQYAGEDEVIFGIIVSGRNVEFDGVESMIGLFINSVPVRMACKGNQEFKEWVERIHKSQAEINKHSALGLTEVQKLSLIPQGQPLFESLFAHQNYPTASLQNMANSAIDFKSVGVKDVNNFPLTVFAFSAKDISFLVSYQTQMFSSVFIEQLLKDLCLILERFGKADENDLIKELGAIR